MTVWRDLGVVALIEEPVDSIWEFKDLCKHYGLDPAVLKKIVEDIWNFELEKSLSSQNLISCWNYEYKNAKSNIEDGVLPCEISEV